VTYEWFIVAGRAYAVTELTQLRTVRGGRDPFASRAMVTAGILMTGTAVLVTVAKDTAPLGPRTYLAIGAAAALLFLLATVGYRMRPRSFELWAEYRGRTVRLFCTASERQYGQATRALLRAREMQQLGPARDPWAHLDPVALSAALGISRAGELRRVRPRPWR
jgi:hypothetical protein